MANVSPTNSARADRGQLMLVTALVLATMFVLLAVVLNGVIYTENYSTRPDAGHEVREAIQFTDATTGHLERALADANDENASYATLNDALFEAVSTWNGLAVRHRVVNANDVELTVVDVVNGTWIRHGNQSRSFTNVDTDPNWGVASGAQSIRSFDAEVVAARLVDPANSSTVADLRTAAVFNISVIDSTGADWGVYLYRDGSTVTARVATPNGTLQPACSAAAGANGRVPVSLTNGTVGGADCAPLDFINTLSTPLAIQFGAGDNAAGTYSLAVEQHESVVDDGDFAAGDDGSRSPYTTETLVSADVEIRYLTTVVGYRTTVSISPEDANA